MFNAESVRILKAVTFKSCFDFDSKIFFENDFDFNSIIDVFSQTKCKKQTFNSIQKCKKSKHNITVKQKTFAKNKKQIKKIQNCFNFKIMNQHYCEIYKKNDKKIYCWRFYDNDTHIALF